MRGPCACGTCHSPYLSLLDAAILLALSEKAIAITMESNVDTTSIPPAYLASGRPRQVKTLAMVDIATFQSGNATGLYVLVGNCLGKLGGSSVP